MAHPEASTAGQSVNDSVFALFEASASARPERPFLIVDGVPLLTYGGMLDETGRAAAWLPRGFHRIRHYGLLAASSRKNSLALARKLLNVAAPAEEAAADDPPDPRPPCPYCGGQMIVIETFERWQQPRAPPTGLVPIRELVP